MYKKLVITIITIVILVIVGRQFLFEDKSGNKSNSLDLNQFVTCEAFESQYIGDGRTVSVAQFRNISGKTIRAFHCEVYVLNDYNTPVHAASVNFGSGTLRADANDKLSLNGFVDNLIIDYCVVDQIFVRESKNPVHDDNKNFTYKITAISFDDGEVYQTAND